MSIQSIGVSIQNWDPLLTQNSGKMDQSTIIHYECQLGDVREPQSLISLLSYIENRFMALQSAAIKSGTFGQSTSNFNNNSFKNRDQQKRVLVKCVFCPDAKTHIQFTRFQQNGM